MTNVLSIMIALTELALAQEISATEHQCINHSMILRVIGILIHLKTDAWALNATLIINALLTIKRNLYAQTLPVQHCPATHLISTPFIRTPQNKFLTIPSLITDVLGPLVAQTRCVSLTSVSTLAVYPPSKPSRPVSRIPRSSPLMRQRRPQLQAPRPLAVLTFSARQILHVNRINAITPNAALSCSPTPSATPPMTIRYSVTPHRRYPLCQH